MAMLSNQTVCLFFNGSYDCVGITHVYHNKGSYLLPYRKITLPNILVILIIPKEDTSICWVGVLLNFPIAAMGIHCDRLFHFWVENNQTWQLKMSV